MSKRRSTIVLAGSILAGAPLSQAVAGEGGSSAYLPGGYNDFAVAVSGPPGVYLRNDLIYLSADIEARPLSGAVEAKVDEELWANLVKLAFVGNGKVFGATPGLAVVIPIIPSVDVGASLTGPGGGTVGTSGGSEGLGDLFVAPTLNWAGEENHVTLQFGVYMPTGQYDPQQGVNLSRNYWALDPAISYTYLNKAGLDISATAGVLFNFENKETDYTTGDELHLDVTVAKHFSPTFAAGLTGYWYEQLSDDKGNLPAVLPKGFKGSAIGLGPAVTNTWLLGGKTPLILTAKWIHDLDAKNRFKGDTFMIALATKL